MRKTGGTNPPTGRSFDVGTREFHGGGIDRTRMAARRMKKGECATCGMRLYKQGGLLGKKFTPLTVPGDVLDGRCLKCYPLDEAEKAQIKPHVLDTSGIPVDHPDPPMEVPQVLTVNDDATVVSAITVEHFPPRPQVVDDAIMPSPLYEGDEHPDDVPLARPPMRPEASSGLVSSMPPGAPRRGMYPDQPVMLQRTGTRQNQIEQSLPSGAVGHNVGRVPLGSQPKARKPSWQPDTISETRTYDGSVDESNDIVFDVRANAGHSSYSTNEHDTAQSLDLESFDSLPVHRDHAGQPRPTSSSNKLNPIRLQEMNEDRPVQPSPSQQSSLNVDMRSFDSLYRNTRTRESLHSIEDVESLLTQLESTSNGEKKAQLLDSLTMCIWDIGGPAKDTVVSSNGVDMLATILWEEMSNPLAVKAVASLILALVAQADASREVHIFTTAGAADGLMDALLIAMQTQADDEELQEMGCRIFCCLASQSAGDAQVNDGSLSGAVQSILKAMDVHTESERIQEWGARALYNQCVYSRNAEPNKRTLANASLDSGFTGSTVLQRILQNFPATEPVVECCCNLYWVLSASADIAAMISPATEPMRHMYRLLRELSEAKPTSTPAQEAILGALSNFTAIDKNRDEEDETDTVFFLFDVMRSFGSDHGVFIESCNLITSMASGRNVNKDVIVQDGGVRFLVDALSSFERDPAVIDALLRALVVLSHGSVATKSELCEPSTLSFVLELCASLQAELRCQEMCCTLLATILMPETLGQDHPEQGHIIDYLIFVTNAYPDSKRLHDACCRVIRNLSCYPAYIPLLANDEVLKILVDAMCNFSDTGSIHASACCALWNIRYDGLTSEHIQCILTTLQNHLDNQEVVQMGCGALWTIVSGSEERKRELVKSEGGVETIACVLMMHPDTDQLLETACGLLTSLTVDPELVEDVVSTQAFHNVADAMRSESVSVILLESGALFMRNVCLVFSEFAKEASSVIPPVMQGMTKHMDEANFQKAACSFLWLVATQSSEAKSKILALDGVTTLMNTVEQYSGLEDVEEAALGAFRELTLSY